jgi:hypothetical protein
MSSTRIFSRWSCRRTALTARSRMRRCSTCWARNCRGFFANSPQPWSPRRPVLLKPVKQQRGGGLSDDCYGCFFGHDTRAAALPHRRRVLPIAVLLPPTGAPAPQAAVAGDRLAPRLDPRLPPRSRRHHMASSDGKYGIGKFITIWRRKPRGTYSLLSGKQGSKEIPDLSRADH